MAIEDVEQLAFERGAREDAVEQVRPIERANKLDGILQFELRADIAPHARGCRRGIGVDAEAGEHLPQASELTVFRSEVVAPLADAVGFVHGEEARIPRRQSGDEAVAAFTDEPFG